MAEYLHLVAIDVADTHNAHYDAAQQSAAAAEADAFTGRLRAMLPEAPNTNVVPKPVGDPSRETVAMVGAAGMLFAGALIVGASVLHKKVIRHFSAA